MDWSEAIFIEELVLGSPFVFCVMFSRWFRTPAHDAVVNFRDVLLGRKYFWSLAWKPGHIPVADTVIE